MTMLRTGFYFSKSFWTPPVVNQVPSLTPAVLNFDLKENSAPVGIDVDLSFNVPPRNAAPTLTTAVLNFDLNPNTPPSGEDHTLYFVVS